MAVTQDYILGTLPKHLKGIFQNVPDAILFGPNGMSMIMSQVQVHCGLRPEDEMKDVMNASMDVKRKANESITTWLINSASLGAGTFVHSSEVPVLATASTVPRQLSISFSLMSLDLNI